MSITYEMRKKTILEQLESDGKVHVIALAKELNVSTETIRRDLERLDREGRLSKVYGGAIKAGTDSSEPPFELKTAIRTADKRAIGQRAASLIRDGDSVMLGNGTSTLAMIEFLASKKDVTLVTHSAPAIIAAMEGFPGRIIFIGGEMNASQKTAGGALAEQMLRQLKVNKTFISPGGISITDGITEYDVQEASISRQMMERADEVIVLADHSKLGKATFSRICAIKEVSLLITDWNCPQEWRQLLADQDIELMLVEEEGARL